MKILIFLLFCVSQARSQISCNFSFSDESEYVCELSIENLLGFDSFTDIPGDHQDGFTDDDVATVRMSSGISPIIPQIICQKFNFLTTFILRERSVGVQTISEETFSNCSVVEIIVISSPVSTIHFNAFRHNLRLNRLILDSVQLVSLPSELLRENRELVMFDCWNVHWLTDLPLNFYQSNSQLQYVYAMYSYMGIFRPEWYQHLTFLKMVVFEDNWIRELPRNSFNSKYLNWISFARSDLRQLDYFSINTDALYNLDLTRAPIQALDFNIFDRAKNLFRFQGMGMICVSLNFIDFNEDREEYIELLEPCFDAFDNRILTFLTSGPSPTFNSIRREKILLGVQITSDAVLTFSSNPDGSGSNFEIHLGVNNSRSEIYENGVWQIGRSTPELLNPSRLESFEITWENGMIFVTHQTPILVHFRTDLFPVRFLGVRSGIGLHASWRIQQLK